MGNKRTDQFALGNEGNEKRLLDRLRIVVPSKTIRSSEKLEDYIIKKFYNGEFDPGSG